MARIVLVLAVLAVSTAAPLVYWAAPASALTVAASRVCLAAVLLLLAAGPALSTLRRLSARERWFVVAGGLLLGTHFGVWISSLYFTSTAASVALVATQPMFAAVFGAVFLREAVGRRAMVGMGLAMVGCLVLAGGDFSASGDALLGDAMAVAGAATAAGYLIVGRHVRVAIPLTPYLAAVNVVAGLALLGAALATGARFGGFGWNVYAAIVACAVVPSLIGHTLLNWSVRRFPAHLVTLAILGEPIGASLLTWGFFGEQPPTHAVLGGAIILAGIGVGFVKRRAG